MSFDNLNNMCGIVKVYFDSDIDVYSDFKGENQTFSDKNGVFYTVCGYDNSLETDSRFLNPISRISKLDYLPESDKRSLKLNIKKIARKAVCRMFYYPIARRLFFAINSLISKDSRFTTIQQAYSYAFSGKTTGSLNISHDDFTTLIWLYERVWRRDNTAEDNTSKLLISPREILILHELAHKNTVFAKNMLEIIDVLIYVRKRPLIDTLDSNPFFYKNDSSAPKKTSSNGYINMNTDDEYNNMLFSNVLKHAKNADDVVKTLEFQRLVGSEPSLLLQFGTSFCTNFAIYRSYKETDYKKYSSFYFITSELEPNNLRDRFTARIEAIIKNDSVKKPDISVNNEIYSYISNLSTSKLNKYKNVGTGIGYYNAIILYIFDKIKHFYKRRFSQEQVDFIASIIYYYLYPIFRIQSIIYDKSHDSDSRDFRLSKVSKIIENMVKNGDFCLYTSEFIEQKAKTLYFG